MAEIRKNEMLERLISRVKADGNGVFTAERFLMTVIDLLQGRIDDPDKAGKERLSAAVSEAGFDMERMYNALKAYVERSPSSAHAAEKMQGIMEETERKLASENALELTPEHLLRGILDDPTPVIWNNLPKTDVEAMIREMLGAPAQPETPTVPTERPQPQEPASASERPQPDDAATERKLERLLHRQPDDDTEAAEAEEPQPATPEESKKAISALVERIKGIRRKLLSEIFGQDNAVNVFVTGYFQSELAAMTEKKRVRPRATFLLAGPPGVGKTFLASQAAEALDNMPFCRFDMSEYSFHEAEQEFCGAAEIYKGSRPGNVTGFVAEHPKCVLLFDEIEKANIKVIQLFLQILDAGRIRDNFTKKEVSFKDTIIFFTTNAGKQLYEQLAGDFSELPRKVILKALEKDVSPITGEPFFPAAICSRFASGNVAMLNHMSAYNLRRIAQKELERNAENITNSTGIRVEMNEDIYTALLLAEGGAADARTVRSRSGAFLNTELYELFRLMQTEEASEDKIGEIECVRFVLQLPEDDRNVRTLFRYAEEPDILVFSSEENVQFCTDNSEGCAVFGVQSIPDAERLLHKKDVQTVFIDIGFGRYGTEQKYLNIEDMDSEARNFFWYMKEHFPAIPVYIIKSPEMKLNGEERVSLLKQGVRGVIDMKPEEFRSESSKICSEIHQQNSMITLARANKVLTFESAQSVSPDGKTAEITLFDFELDSAVESEDSASILSSVSKPNIRFSQVIGAEDAKKELQGFMEYLRNPKRYLGTGARPPRGVLLYGPPGTGKTMLAKALACESNTTFMIAEGNQFLKKYVGEGPEKVHEIFRAARKYAPTILFIDEIDAFAKERHGGDHSASNGEDVLTTFLAEMDGFKTDPTKPVFVLAATNFDVEPGSPKSLDSALMRRFDRRIYVDLPNKDERIRYLKMKIAESEIFEISEEQINNIAVRATGMSLASLESVVELAMRSAIYDGGFKVTDAVLEEAFETFTSGEEKKWNEDTLQRVARHEAGHTLLCWLSGENPSYVTVVARGDHGGYMQHDDKEGKAIYTKQELLSLIRTSLGGRAAEIVCYGDKDGLSTGASGDLVSATNTARSIICSYGMDGDFGLSVIEDREMKSDALRGAVNRILSQELDNAVSAIREGRAALDALVAQLLVKNHLSGDEIDGILRPFYPDRRPK